MAYSANLDTNITILTSKYASTQNGIIQGLLYIPDLPTNHPCKELEAQHVPETAVRQRDLPPVDYNLIALVPWFNSTCTKLYMDAAALDPLRGFMVYMPGSNDTTKPPDVDDRIWNLHDHGAWKESSKFPVYALSSSAGTNMMTQLGLYSGNISSVPYGSDITALYSPNEHDYIRIWTQIHISTPSALPTIWVFVLVCVAVLLAFVAFVSCLMHYIQRRRRSSLERRVASGEVNLEAMNIKRVRVPIEHVEKFPLFTYHYEPTPASPPTSPMSPRIPVHARMRDDRISRDLGMGAVEASALTNKAEEKPLASPRSTVTGFTNTSNATDYQPHCTICLEEYENRTSIIRELPCGHIFHPDCIDEFLSENSSLCPLCKASMLPPGYSPPITNAMVRRERAVRRLRGRVTDIDDGGGEQLQERAPMRNWHRGFTRKLYRPSNSPAAVAVQQAPDRHSPTAEARMRMRSLAGIGSDDGEGSEGQPRWKQVTRAVFPGFR